MRFLFALVGIFLAYSSLANAQAGSVFVTYRGDINADWFAVQPLGGQIIIENPLSEAPVLRQFKLSGQAQWTGPKFFPYELSMDSVVGFEKISGKVIISYRQSYPGPNGKEQQTTGVLTIEPRNNRVTHQHRRNGLTWQTAQWHASQMEKPEGLADKKWEANLPYALSSESKIAQGGACGDALSKSAQNTSPPGQ